MQITNEQTERILTNDFAFTQLGFSMMVTRLRSIYSKNPSQANLQNCAKEINAFLSKFQSIMEKDFVTISKI
jgi:hypothetical protein